LRSASLTVAWIGRGRSRVSLSKLVEVLQRGDEKKRRFRRVFGDREFFSAAAPTVH
jgi:hypothetical protein